MLCDPCGQLSCLFVGAVAIGDQANERVMRCQTFRSPQSFVEHRRIRHNPGVDGKTVILFKRRPPNLHHGAATAARTNLDNR